MSINDSKLNKHKQSQEQKITLKSNYSSNKKAYLSLKTINEHEKGSFSLESTYSMKGGGCGDETIDDGNGSCGGNKSYD